MVTQNVELSHIITFKYVGEKINHKIQVNRKYKHFTLDTNERQGSLNRPHRKEFEKYWPSVTLS